MRRADRAGFRRFDVVPQAAAKRLERRRRRR
jgi:hypothetical protein